MTPVNESEKFIADRCVERSFFLEWLMQQGRILYFGEFAPRAKNAKEAGQ